MANKRLGVQTSWDGSYAETVTEARQLLVEDSGKVFFFDEPAITYVINLPKLSSINAGWNAKFIASTDIAGGQDVEILAYGESQGGGGSVDDSNTCYVTELSATDTATATATGKDGIKFEGGQYVANDMATIITDGTNWYIHVFIHDANNVDTV